jgi:glycosyltransferase involved in cell wall biosynthesis
MQKITVVVPSYKNEKWCEKNIGSILAQEHDNFSVIYTDDCSPDQTADKVEAFVKNSKAGEKVRLVRNPTRLGAMKNLYDMIHSCDDNDIVVTVDGDDWLAHSGVLRRLEREYSDPSVWFTWGSYMDYPGNNRGCSKKIPPGVVERKGYRRHPWCTSHLRTFRAKLFKHIKEADFKDPDGKWLDMAWDLAFYIPFVEMAGQHGRYIHDTLYIYNNENPIQDYKKNINRQMAMDRFIRSKPKYPTLNEL